MVVLHSYLKYSTAENPEWDDYRSWLVHHRTGGGRRGAAVQIVFMALFTSAREGTTYASLYNRS